MNVRNFKIFALNFVLSRWMCAIFKYLHLILFSQGECAPDSKVSGWDKGSGEAWEVRACNYFTFYLYFIIFMGGENSQQTILWIFLFLQYFLFFIHFLSEHQVYFPTQGFYRSFCFFLLLVFALGFRLFCLFECFSSFWVVFLFCAFLFLASLLHGHIWSNQKN